MNRLGKRLFTLLLTAAVTIGCFPAQEVLAFEELAEESSSEVLYSEDSSSEDLSSKETVSEDIAESKAVETEDLGQYLTPIDLNELYPVGGIIDNGFVAPAVEEDENDMLGIAAAYPASISAYQGKELEFIDALNLPNIRNQSIFGACWSFATLDAVEGAAMNNAALKLDKNLDFSEWNLVYRMFNFDAKNEISKDSINWEITSKAEDAEAKANCAAFGGNPENAFNLLMNWRGAVSEEKDPYPIKKDPATGAFTADLEALKGVNADVYADDVIHLSDYKILNIKENPNLVKKAITENGMVTIIYHAAQGAGKYYDVDNACQYDDSGAPMNHGIAVVGWDDNFSKDNFGGTYYQAEYGGVKYPGISQAQYDSIVIEDSTVFDNPDISSPEFWAHCPTENKYFSGANLQNNWYFKGTNSFKKMTDGVKPKNNGAWLCRNSWDKYPGSIGQENVSGVDYTGYFWLSYEDTTLKPNAYVCSVNITDDYDNLYSLDGTSYDSSITLKQNNASVANVFCLTADMLNPDTKSETIKAVAFKTVDADLDYTVSLYGFKDGSYTSLAQPTNGQLLGTTKGRTDAAGYYQVNLDKPISVPCGTTVAVVVDFTTKNDSIRISIESEGGTINQDLNGDGIYTAKQTVTTEALNGESWLLNLNGDDKWADINALLPEKDRHNLRIKLYTDSSTETVKEVEDKKVTFKDVEEGKWYQKAVSSAVRYGIMSGVSEDKFAPEDICSRTMMVTILNNMSSKEEAPEGAVNPFKDVENNKWYTKPIIWAYSKGLTKGISSTKFGMKTDLTREQVATLLYSFAKSNGYDVSKKEDLKKFKDAKETSAWAKEAISWAVGSGIISGKSGKKLDPKGTATRAEVAQMGVNFANVFMK